MSRKLDDLTPAFRTKAMELLARSIEAGIPVIIIDTVRTLNEQEENVRRGVSWTMKSKHLEGRAIDIAPYEEWRQYGADKISWDPLNPSWSRLGAIGEALGLTWGGRWKKRDLGHFEEKDNEAIPA